MDPMTEFEWKLLSHIEVLFNLLQASQARETALHNQLEKAHDCRICNGNYY